MTNGILALLQTAQATPAATPSGIWASNGDKIIVAVVTTVITTVVVLILSESIKALLKKIGSWIETAFAGLGWRFRKRYLAALADGHRWLKLIGVYSSTNLHAPRLQEVYVSLRLAAAKGDDGPRFAWNDVLAPEEKRLVILGSPGAGKSTLLDYLVLVFTGAVRHPLRERLGGPFPLIARLRELGSEGAESLTALLAKTAPLKQIPAGYPERWLKRGGCIVLLDGLDEVLDESRHVRAVREIESLVGDYPENVYVVTCRVAGWRNQLPGFRTWEIQPFTGDDIRKFLGVWYREVLRTQAVNLLGVSPKLDQMQEAERTAFEEAGRRVEALWQSLSGNEGLLRIASTPLLLSLMAFVHYHKVDLPKGRARLYGDCVEILLDLWDRKDKRLELPEVTLKEKRMVLEAIAFHYLKEDLLEADLPMLAGLVQPVLPKIKVQITAENLLQQIWKRSGILQEQRLGFYGFAHRALHDYLAAACVVEHERDALLLERAGEERWREVILIAAGLAPAGRAARLVESLLARGGESGAELEMAGLTLAEDVQLGDDLRAEVKKRLLDRLTKEEAAGPFRRLASALVTADLEAARQWMEDVLRGRDPERQKRVLALLPELGETQSKPMASLLVRLIGEETGEAGIRAQAAQVLAGIRFSPDAETWRVLESAQQGAPALRRAAAWAWCELGRAVDFGLVKVPAGEFLMGSREGDVHSEEKPQHPLYLPDFYIGKAPVTVEAFRNFLRQSGHPLEDQADFDRWNKHTDHPVVGVSWHDALAFAGWQGYVLPSEAEWEKAARGTDGRQYPWGNEWKAECANTSEYWGTEGGRRLPWAALLPRKGHSTTTPVGRFSPQGDSPYNCVDMAGNVWELTRSCFSTYPYDSLDGREDLEASAQAARVIRGGAFAYTSRYVRCAFRYVSSQDGGNVFVGFRVVLYPFRSDI
ncbi:MAG TPA: SUMF1/EgtB/PvdO family nonheme iron enzyme [Thermoanaerobaculia bacterium]|jgi:formylglycine-generating enzyme required for sulfatase activity|nr:SUMF1/EgtB/PvdO family nonheme iron enzyme [Thermoanaerobaculia bacterium]